MPITKIMRRPDIFEAIRFDGGIDSAKEILSQLHDWGCDASYRPDYIQDGRTVIEAIEIKRYRRQESTYVMAGSWIVHEFPELYVRSDEQMNEQYQVAISAYSGEPHGD